MAIMSFWCQLSEFCSGKGDAHYTNNLVRRLRSKSKSGLAIKTYVYLSIEMSTRYTEIPESSVARLQANYGWHVSWLGSLSYFNDSAIKRAASHIGTSVTHDDSQ